MIRAGAIVSLVLALAASRAAPAFPASDYPNYPVQFIITFPPGGPGDTTIRLIHPALQNHLGGPIELVNRPGGGGAAGFTYVAKAKADGYTILSTMSPPLTVGTALRDLGFSLDDFQYLGAYAFDDTAIVSRPDPRWKSFDEMLAYARANPGKLSYGSAGQGTNSFFTMELLKLARGLDVAHVPFGGSGPAKNAILGGHVQVGAISLSTMIPVMKSGDVIGLVISGDKRNPAVPDVPTMAEKGVAEASLSTVMELYAPAKTPKPVVDRLAEALAASMKNPDAIAAFEKAGLEVFHTSPDVSRQQAEREYEVVLAAAKKLGLVK